MNQTSSSSLADLRRETEETRAGLTSTVEQLKSTVSETADDIRRRVSPEAIKEELSKYVRNRGERLLDDVTAAARRNPMQAVAVGASVAYPLLKLARAIPLPILMVGAGLFFAGTKTGQSATQKASDLASGLSDDVLRRGRNLSDQVGASLDTARSAVAGAADSARETVDAAVAGVRDSASGLAEKSDTMRPKAEALADRIGDRTQEATDRVAGLVGEAAGAAKEWISDTSASVRNAASSGKNAALDVAQGLRQRTVEVSDRAGKTVFQTIEQNPLLVAGIGLLIGGLIASALPRSGIEDDLVGEASSAAKKRAQEAASKGFDLAKGAAGEAFENVARTAGAEGLSTDALGDAAKDIGQRVKRVAEAAVTTAFDPDSAKSSAQGEHHG
jgi:hypothetical protein